MAQRGGPGQLLSNALTRSGRLTWKGVKMRGNYFEQELDPDDDTYKNIEAAMQTSIRTHRGNRGGKFSSYEILGVNLIKKIFNQSLIDRYNSYRPITGNPNERLLFHGTSEVEKITKQGFDKSEVNPNGMFGGGFYFADLSSKANQYVGGGDNGVRKMLLCRVNMGRTKKQTTGEKYDTAPPGYHSVTGVPSPTDLTYREFIVYKRNQIYPEFVITYKLKTKRSSKTSTGTSG